MNVFMGAKILFFLKMGKQNALDIDFILNFRP